ncbi:hypothetical protein JNB71_01680 [Rhizobium herbae]|uniref:RiboL-PSP-HEPN domain-containing protein n=1 Tax=Rhizobium herbae TaxID=508661 RepID=A0ABS7H589_9HYPH|nr:hypothetical protein [Rhizobium herbae]MBW9062015.1 hypothetical protein [Rhizobium herbae]
MSQLSPFDYNKAVAELPVLRDFIDFINRQIGVYTDSVSSYDGNKIRIERQVARVLHRTGKQIEDGQEVMMHTSFEDHNSPKVIHISVTSTDQYMSANSEKGFNHQQTCWAIIVFMFAFWNEEVRPKIARIREVEVQKVVVDAFGDLRIVRNAIIHNKGIMSAKEYGKLKVMSQLFQADKTIRLSHDQMHSLFVYIKQAIASIIMEYVGHLPGAPEISEIAGVAIQAPR